MKLTNNYKGPDVCYGLNDGCETCIFYEPGDAVDPNDCNYIEDEYEDDVADDLPESVIE